MFVMEEGLAKSEKSVSREEVSQVLKRIREDPQQYEKIKEIEKVTNHDIKAVEYYIKQELQKDQRVADLSEFVHYTCTSEDINNVSHALMLTEAYRLVSEKQKKLFGRLQELSQEYAGVAMMGRTHGQSATPTTMGKELANFVYRLDRIH